MKIYINQYLYLFIRFSETSAIAIHPVDGGPSQLVLFVVLMHRSSASDDDDEDGHDDNGDDDNDDCDDDNDGEEG